MLINFHILYIEVQRVFWNSTGIMTSEFSSLFNNNKIFIEFTNVISVASKYNVLFDDEHKIIVIYLQWICVTKALG